MSSVCIVVCNSWCAYRLCVSIYTYIQCRSFFFFKYFNITSSTNNLFRLSYTYRESHNSFPPFFFFLKYHACVANRILYSLFLTRSRHLSFSPSHANSLHPVLSFSCFLFFNLVNTKSHSLNSSRRLRTPKADHSLSALVESWPNSRKENRNKYIDYGEYTNSSFRLVPRASSLIHD